MRKNIGFTLVEVLVAVALTGMILLTGYSAFQKIMQSQSRLGATIDVQKNLFYTNEKLAALIREGGTVDYEEYFNRRMLGYVRGMRTDGVFTFTNYSHFGNGDTTPGRPPIYYCGMLDTAPDPDVSTWVDAESCMSDTDSVLLTPSTGPSATTNFAALSPQQPYGQYAALAFNYLDPVGFPMPIKLPPIFKTTSGATIEIFDTPDSNILITRDPINVGLPELYLIKKNLDNDYTRTYFRHVYVDESSSDSYTCTPTTNLNGCIGKIQMLKLESCDELLANGTAGSDGIIDAWIPLPDFMVGTVTCPNEPSEVDDIYLSAHEETITGGTPPDPNLTWVDVTSPDMNVLRATFLPHPLKIPSLMSGAGEKADAPRISVYLEVALSTRLRNKSFVRPTENYPRTLITTYDLSE